MNGEAGDFVERYLLKKGLLFTAALMAIGLWLLSGFYILLPAILIFFQPNLGSVLILFCLWLNCNVDNRFWEMH